MYAPLGGYTPPPGPGYPPSGPGYPPPGPGYAPPATSRSGAPRTLLALIAVIVIVAAGLGAVMVLRPGSGDAPSASPRIPGASLAAGDTGGTAALATPAVVAGHIDDSGLEPPLLEQGDVPPPDQTTPVTGHLALGAATDLATQTIGPGGGTLEASGLRIQVPDGALAGDTSFQVTQAPITGSDLGDVVTPLTPLFNVNDAGVVLGAPVTVTLPMSIPTGATAMAFSYDDASGTLTPLIPMAQDGSTLTVGATHFSGIFGGLLDLAKLPTTVDSGFRPGIDDWQFKNHGSYVAPGGQCEGQSVSAMWYYLNMRRGAGASPLYGLYDNNGAEEKTPTFWQDDSDAFRMVGSMHVDPLVVPFTYNFFKNMVANPDDRFTYAAFRAAIAMTGRPQMVRIETAARDKAHAMIVYRVTPDRLFVADPNFPAHLRTILYDAATGRFAPFSSGSNAADIAEHGATVFTRFGYIPGASSWSDSGIAAHWAEFEAGTAGDTAFPKYDLEALSGTDADGNDVWVPLVDGYQTTEKQLTIRINDPANRDDVAIGVFRGTSSTQLGPLAATQILDLQDGANDFGIELDGSKRTDTTWHYVDFVRLTINLSSLELTVDPTEVTAGEVGSEYTFQASATGIPGTAKQVTFSWDFGDGPVVAESYNAPYAEPLTSQGKHSFLDEGTHTVTVILSDTTGTAPVELGRREVPVEIAAATATGGAWVLDGAPVKIGGEAVDNGCMAYTFDVAEGTVGISRVGHEDVPNCPSWTASMTGTWSPTSPPTTLHQYDSVPFAFTTSVTGEAGTVATMVVDATYPNGAHMAIKYAQFCVSDPSEACPASGSSQTVEVENWPGGDSAATTITVEIYAHLDGATQANPKIAGYRYTYRWQP